MTGPIHLGAAWLLVLATVGMLAMAAAVWYLWFPKELRDYWTKGTKADVWPRLNEGGGYEWPDGRITRDFEGKIPLKR